MNTQNEPQAWLSLTEYSVKYDVSISTLRRYIKEDRLSFQLVEGKYIVEDKSLSKKKRGRRPAPEDGLGRGVSQKVRLLASKLSNPRASQELQKIKKENEKQKEELLELKMYIRILEEKLGLSSEFKS